MGEIYETTQKQNQDHDKSDPKYFIPRKNITEIPESTDMKSLKTNQQRHKKSLLDVRQ